MPPPDGGVKYQSVVKRWATRIVYAFEGMRLNRQNPANKVYTSKIAGSRSEAHPLVVFLVIS